MKNIGLIYALSAYTIWGVAPIYWRFIDHIPSLEIVAHRMIWSCIFVILYIILVRESKAFLALLRQPGIVARLTLAALLSSTNWAIYIWAVNAEHIVETSMGYFINPLLSVLLGFIFFHERLRRRQVLAISVAALGVAYLVAEFGEFPWIALSLALTFGLYGALKKSLDIPATHGVAIETLTMVLIALAYLSYLTSTGTGSGAFLNSWNDSLFLILGGIFTLAPLLLFSSAAKRISLTALGMSQYLGPTLQLIIGVFVFSEPFGSEKQIAFSLIWLGLLVYSVDQLLHRRRLRGQKLSV